MRNRLRFCGFFLLGLLPMAGSCGPEPAFSLRLAASDPSGGGDATLAPDGGSFVTTSRRAGNWDLWVFDLAREEWRRATTDEGDDFEGRFSPDGRKLVFTSTRDGFKNVWVKDLDSGEFRRLTSSPHEDEYPAWSPDGLSVVYTGGPWKGRDYFVVPADGGPSRRVSKESGRAGACSFFYSGEDLICHRYDLGTGDVIRVGLDGRVTPLTLGKPWDYKPTPSPDGRWIAFSRSEEGPSYIAVMPAEGGEVRRLTRSPHDDRWPTWSDDGSLLFHRLVQRGTAVKLYDRETGKVRELVGADQAPLQASLDPDGKRLAFCSQQAMGKILKILDLESGAIRPLDTGPGEACYPRWSPDGERLAFAAKPADRWEICLMRPDGSGFVNLTLGLPGLRGMDGPVDWSPDSSKLLFHADSEPFEANLFTVDVESGRLSSLTWDAWFDEAPSWSPDGRVLFMSTRGGDWTWGIFSLDPRDGRLETLGGPDWEAKNYPRMASGGEVVWSAEDDAGIEFLYERAPSGQGRRLEEAGPGARWPAYSADGKYVLYTAVERHVEYWIARNLFETGSPLRLDTPAAAEQVRMAAPQESASLGSDGLDRSPVDLHRR